MRFAKGKRITAHDREQLQRFANDLQRHANLQKAGHVKGCASLQVGEAWPCSCPAGLTVPRTVEPANGGSKP